MSSGTQRGLGPECKHLKKETLIWTGLEARISERTFLFLVDAILLIFGPTLLLIVGRRRSVRGLALWFLRRARGDFFVRAKYFALLELFLGAAILLLNWRVFVIRLVVLGFIAGVLLIVDDFALLGFFNDHL